MDPFIAGPASGPNPSKPGPSAQTGLTALGVATSLLLGPTVETPPDASPVGNVAGRLLANLRGLLPEEGGNGAAPAASREPRTGLPCLSLPRRNPPGLA